MLTPFSLIPPTRAAKTRVDKDLATRLAPFLERGLITSLPTTWQLLCGQLEMAPYVVLPDAGDKSRYDGAACGHPMLRTPLILSQIGWEHLRIGHGLDTSLETLVLHLAYVFHEGMPIFDLQLIQTHPGGLERLRTTLAAIDASSDPFGAHHHRLSSLVIPDAAAYRRCFLAPGGWIDRAAAFDYPAPESAAAFLRSEFTQLVTFIDYCQTTFPRSPRGESPWTIARTLADLGSRRLREKGR